MSALDDNAIVEALRKYVLAHGGDPNSTGCDVVLAEREIEEAIQALVDLGLSSGDYCPACDRGSFGEAFERASANVKAKSEAPK